MLWTFFEFAISTSVIVGYIPKAAKVLHVEHTLFVAEILHAICGRPIPNKIQYKR